METGECSRGNLRQVEGLVEAGRQVEASESMTFMYHRYQCKHTDLEIVSTRRERERDSRASRRVDYSEEY